MKIKNKQNSSVRRPAYTTWAFTLVELIVVITILAILGTIAFISLQGYSAQARDSKRLSDISNIKKSVELFSLNTGKYPKPDDSVTMSYSGEALWYQGTVGDQVSINVSRNLNEKPTDPSTGNEYTYSTTYSQIEYEVLGLYESDILGTNVGANLVFAQQSNAATLDYPKIDGNYNGIYIKIPSFYVPTPSIINAEILSNDDLDDDMIKSQIITGGDNLPLASTGGLNVNFAYYEGTMTEDSTDAEKMALVEVIQSAYSGTDLASDTMYADLLSRAGTGELVDFVDVIVLGKAEYTNSSSSNTIVCDTGYIWNGESCEGVITDIDGNILEVDYYISSTGSNSNDGSVDSPFADFTNIPSNSNVVIKEGEYSGMTINSSYLAIAKIFTGLSGKNNINMIGIGDVFINVSSTSSRDEPVLNGLSNSLLKDVIINYNPGSSTNYKVSISRVSPNTKFQNVIFNITNYYSLNYHNDSTPDQAVEYHQCTFNGGTRLSNYSGYHIIVD